MDQKPHLLCVRDAQFSYTKKTPIIGDIHLKVHPGEVVGLVGPNGSGKSTLIKLIFDLLELRKGNVTIAGHDHRAEEARLSSIYLPSEDNLPEFLTGLEYLRLIADLYGQSSRIAKDLIASMFRQFGMQGRERNLIEDYSHGMRKKTQLIGAFLLQLPLTVIDETLNGIDLDALRKCQELLLKLRSSGHGILLCTHDFSLLEEIADRVVVLTHGTVVDEIHREEYNDSDGRLKDSISRILL